MAFVTLFWENTNEFMCHYVNFEELLEKYQALLVENSTLKEEIENLNAKLSRCSDINKF